jgi:hypothetical protein
MDRRTLLQLSLAATLLPLANSCGAAKRKRTTVPVILPTPKQRLGGALDLYVNALSGNDSYDGWSPASPKRTIQAAYEYARSEFDLNGHGMLIHLAPTNVKYARVNAVGGLVGAHIFHIQGDDDEPHSAIIEAPPHTNCINVQDGAGCVVSGIGLQGGVNSSGFLVRQNSLLDYQNIAFFAMGGAHVQVEDVAVASCTGPEWIWGDAAVHWSASGVAKLNVGYTVTIPNSTRTIGHFLMAQNCAAITGSPIFAGYGNAGKKGLVQLNASVHCGDVPGTEWVTNYGGERV